MSFIGIAGIKIKRAGLSPGLLIFVSCTQILPWSRMFFMSPDAFQSGPGLKMKPPPPWRAFSFLGSRE
jgi:hypothetical protein